MYVCIERERGKKKTKTFSKTFLLFKILHIQCNFQKTLKAIKRSKCDLFRAVKLIVHAFRINFGIRHFALHVCRLCNCI